METIDAPNTVPEVPDAGSTLSRPGTGNVPTRPVSAVSRPGSGVADVEAQNDEDPNPWNTEGDEALDDSGPMSIASEDDEKGLSEEDTKILLEKEFDDYYEDRVHKSAAPVVFLSKCLGMLPVIWTDDDEENECKTYFNMYTFLIILCWIGMSVVTGYRIDLYNDKWPAQNVFTSSNSSHYGRFFGRMTLDSYSGAIFSNCIVAIIFGVFKSKAFADVLLLTSNTDSQLEVKEKHYEKIKSKTMFWIFVILVIFVAHGVGIFFLLEEYGRDIILFCCFMLPNFVIVVLDLQYIHFSIVLCKRYRMLDKIINLIVKPFTTFRGDEEVSNETLQKILSYRYEAKKKEEARNTFDQIWMPETESVDLPDSKDYHDQKTDYSKEDVPTELLMRVAEKEISREEENTVILQLDILRGIHSSLHQVGQDVNSLFGFQMLVNIITTVFIIVMFGFYLATTAYDGKFFWPFAVIVASPILRILYIGHWAQVLKDTSEKPFWSMSHMSTMDGSPRLERQVQKCLVQTGQQTAEMTASGYFSIDRNTITRVIGVVLLGIFLMVKFDRLERCQRFMHPNMTNTTMSS